MIATSPKPQRIQHQSGRQGVLRLHFALVKGQTILRESYSHAPLQVMRPIADVCGGLQIYMLSPTGGVVQGDEYNIEIVLDAGTQALITTIAANKVYRMPDGLARQTIRITVKRGALLEFVPDAVILFKDSELEQDINITLEDGATCIFQDSVMGGRIARNEVLQFRRYFNRIEVSDDKGLLLYDRVDYQPQPQDREQVGLLDGCAVWGSWYAFGNFAERGMDMAAFCQQHHDFEAKGVLGSISTLYRNGIAARFLSNRLESIEASFEYLRQAIREAMNLSYLKIRK